jgi:hypothetical protein
MGSAKDVWTSNLIVTNLRFKPLTAKKYVLFSFRLSIHDQLKRVVWMSKAASNGPWCITFKFAAGDAFRAHFEQYH